MFIFAALVALRHALYRWKILKMRRVDAFVISVGNITVGGSGKTPCVIKLVSELKSSSVALLTRGYKSSAEHSKDPVQLKLSHTAQEVGDEALLFAHRFPQVPVFISKYRYRSARKAIYQGAKILILEDGMQHIQLQRDLELVVVDAHDPWGGGYFIPRGRLRDHPRELYRANFIVVTHAHAWDKEKENTLRQYTQAPCIFTEHCPEKINVPKSTPVAVFCGIAKPRYFVDTVTQLGYSVVSTLFSMDHCLPRQENLQAWAEDAKQKGALFLLCTEKDAVKLPKHLNLPLPLEVVKISLDIVRGHESWDQLLLILSECKRSFSVESV